MAKKGEDSKAAMVELDRERAGVAAEEGVEEGDLGRVDVVLRLLAEVR